MKGYAVWFARAKRDGPTPLAKQDTPAMDTVIPKDTVFFLDQYGKSFAKVWNKDHFEVWPVQGREFKRIAIGWLMKNNIRVCQQNNSNLRDTCEGMCYTSGEEHSLYTRVAETEDGVIWLDLRFRNGK